MSFKLTDFSPIDSNFIQDDIQKIGVSTIINSDRAVKRNLGIYKTKAGLRTGRYSGITWLRNKDGGYLLDGEGKKQPLIIYPRFGLNIDTMIQKIVEDDEFFEYLCDDKPEGERMFTFLFNEEMMEVKDEDSVCDNRLMAAMSYIHLLYIETRRSLMKKIVRKDNNFTGKVKGKILFNQQIRKNIIQGHEERIYCSYVEKSEDIFENRILKCALLQAKEYLNSKKIKNGQVLREIKACEMRFLNVSEVEDINPEEIDNIELPAMYTNYEQVMKLAYLVIAQISMTSTVQNDTNKIIPYAVNTPLLFECYCRTLLKESLKNNLKKNKPGWKMLKFVSDKAVEYDETEYGIRTIPPNYYISGKIVPDIVLVKKNKYIVLDVKYKEFWWDEKNCLPQKSDRREDRLQLLAYNVVYQPIVCGHICPAFFETVDEGREQLSLEERRKLLPILWFCKETDSNKKVSYYMFSAHAGVINIEDVLDED